MDEINAIGMLAGLFGVFCAVLVFAYSDTKKERMDTIAWGLLALLTAAANAFMIYSRYV